MNHIVVAYFAVMAILTYYVLLKEKEAMGCKVGVSIKQFCNDLDSAYVKDSVPLESDSLKETLNKIKESARASQKVAVWRRSLILANVCILLIVLIAYKIFREKDDWCLLIPIHLTIFCINYLHFQYQEFHMHRRIVDNVDKLTAKLEKVVQ